MRDTASRHGPAWHCMRQHGTHHEKSKTAWPSIFAAARSPIASLLLLSNKGSVTFVSAVGKPPGRRLRRRCLSLPRETNRERLRLDTLQPSVNMTGKLPEYWKKYKIQYWKNSSLAILPEKVNVGAFLAIVLDRRRSLHGNIFHVIINIIWGWNLFLAPSSDALFPLDRKVISFIFTNFLDVVRASRRSTQ